jgi:hypothetical protein
MPKPSSYIRNTPAAVSITSYRNTPAVSITICQSIPATIFDYMPKHSTATFIVIPPVSILEPYSKPVLQERSPVLQERSKQETKIYCKIVIILFTMAHATGGGGVRTLFDYMPKPSSYIRNTPAVSITICQSIPATFIIH